MREGKEIDLEGDTAEIEMAAMAGKRGTDDAFYQLMLISGDAVLKLVGVKDPKGYKTKLPKWALSYTEERYV